MKKLFAVLVASLLVSVSSFAQFGVIGGLTSSSSNIKTAVSELKARTINQYHVGVTYKFGIGNVFAIQPSLLYNVKGAKLDEFSVTSVDFKTGYLELPVQLQAGIGLAKIVRVYGILEPFVGYALSNNVTIEGYTKGSWDNVKTRFEYGLGLGAGVELFRHFQIGVKYFWNFGPIYGNDITIGGITKQITSSKCSGVTLSAAILL